MLAIRTGWRLLALAAAALVLLLAACRSEESEPVQEPSPVRTVRVERGTLIERVRLAGRVVPPVDKDATLAPPVAGRLASIEVRAGDRVRTGQVLARVDTAALDDALAAAAAADHRAEAERDFRRRESERTRALFERGVSSRQEAESDEAATGAAEAGRVEAASALAEARRRREWAELRSPFGGIVLRILRSAGEQVDGTSATPVVEVAAETPVEIAADATVEVLPRISPGAEAVIATAGRSPQAPRDPDGTTPSGAGGTGPSGAEGPVPSGAGEPGPSRAEGPAPGEGGVPPRARAPDTGMLPARVAQVARAVDPSTGVGEVRLRLAGPLRPPMLGTSVTVFITLGRRDGAVIVPAAAIRRSQDGATEVVLVEDGKAKARRVATGLVEQGRVEILSGLSGGEVLVVDDPNGLLDGTPLRTLP